MKKLILVFLWLLVWSAAAVAQLSKAYVNYFDDGEITNQWWSLEMISLQNGDFALGGRQVSTETGNYTVVVYRLDSTGAVVNTFQSDPAVEVTSRLDLSEAPDGSIWVTARRVDSDDPNPQDIMVYKLSPDLNVEIEKAIDMGERDGPTSIYAGSSAVFLLASNIVLDTADVLVNRRDLHSLDPSSGDVTNTLANAVPSDAFFNLADGIIGGPDGRIAVAYTTTDPATDLRADLLVIREFSMDDLSVVADYEVAPLSGNRISLDYDYFAPADAYAFADGSLNTLLVHRDSSSSIDTIAAPEGLRSITTRNRVSAVDSSLFILGQNGYRIDFVGGQMDTVMTLTNLESREIRKRPSVDGERIVIAANSNFFNAISVAYSVSDAAFTDTAQLADLRMNAPIDNYFGAFTFDGAGETEPLIGLRARGRLIDSLTTWGHEIIDPETGERTGQKVSTNDIEFWSTGDFDPEISPLVRTQSGYMALVNEFSRITFFKFDENLEALQPNTVGFTAAEFEPRPFLSGDRLTRVKPLSNGIVGSTSGSYFDSDAGMTVYNPYLFASDTSFQVLINKAVDTVPVYPFDPYHIVVDSADRIYSAATETSVDNFFAFSDTIVVTGFEPDGSYHYLSRITIPKSETGVRVWNLALSNDHSELLVSASARYEEGSRGLLIRLDASDGSMKQMEVIDGASDTGRDGPYDNIWTVNAIYDMAGNVISGIVADTRSEGANVATYDVLIQQRDTGGVVESIDLFTSPFIFPDLMYLTRIGESIFASGTLNNSGFTDQQAFIARLHTGELTDVEDVNELAEELSFTAYPNPSDGPITVQWESNTASDYRLQLHDLSGRVLQTWQGDAPSAGLAQRELGLEGLPAGTYLLKIEIEQGRAVIPLVRQ